MRYATNIRDTDFTEEPEVEAVDIHLKVGDTVLVRPKVDFLAEKGVVTKTTFAEQFASFIQVESDLSGKRWYRRENISRVI